MKSVTGTQNLNYQLYSDSARSRHLGQYDRHGHRDWQSGPACAQPHTVYGSVPAAQVVPAGDYSDTITVPSLLTEETAMLRASRPVGYCWFSVAARRRAASPSCRCAPSSERIAPRR